MKKGDNNQTVKKNKDEIPSTPKTRRKGIVLKTPKDAARLINRLINRLLWDTSEENLVVLRTVSYSLGIYLKCFEVGEMQDRLAALEEKIGVTK